MFLQLFAKGLLVWRAIRGWFLHCVFLKVYNLALCARLIAQFLCIKVCSIIYVLKF